MINKYYYNVSLYFYLLLQLLKFFLIISVLKVRVLSHKIVLKKNLFFKKKSTQKNLFSKRLSIVLKKRKKIKFFKKTKKVDNGNFFFKKFFFKTLLRSRLGLRKFFFLNKRVRQTKLTKKIFRQSQTSINKDLGLCTSLLNILLRGGFFFFLNDAKTSVLNNMVYVNGQSINLNSYNISVGDCIQVPVSSFFYNYLIFCRSFFKIKSNIFKMDSWKFFKQKFFKQKVSVKLKKKKQPKFLYMFFLFRFNVTKFLEVDFITLTIYLLRVNHLLNVGNYFLNKQYTFSMFTLYNFKKIN